MWFDKSDINIDNIITIDNLHGFILPHAGTEYTGKILSHTLQFKPEKTFTQVLILYYPAMDLPNINDIYYHEYYVPWKTLEHVCKSFWNIKKSIKFIGLNVRDDLNKLNNIEYMDSFTPESTLFIVSSDFSHFLSFQEAIEVENCSAHSVMHRYFKPKCTKHIDINNSYQALYKIIPNHWMLQWVGRTRSPGLKAVGYLSFLIKESPNPQIKIPDGMFVTAYDANMRQRECLGNWFDEQKPWSQLSENKLINKVVHLAATTSRLTSGKYFKCPISHYTITYLYKDNTKNFIRGWHGILYNSFFLSDVFLENTFENGSWITPYDIVWDYTNYDEFDMSETLDKLMDKADLQLSEQKNYVLYTSTVLHTKL